MRCLGQATDETRYGTVTLRTFFLATCRVVLLRAKPRGEWEGPVFGSDRLQPEEGIRVASKCVGVGERRPWNVIQ